MAVGIIALSRQAEAGVLKNSASAPDSDCASSTDPAESAARISPDSVQLNGLCVHTARFRPVVDLKIDEFAKQIQFKNYSYQGQFWTAVVPMSADAIDEVIFGIKHFTLGGVGGASLVGNALQSLKPAHTQLRFKMSLGHEIKLVNQVTGEKATTNDLALSFEASLVEGLKFNVALATLPMNPLVGRVGETASILKEAPNPLEQYVLNLTAEEKLMVLKAGLRRSNEAGLKIFYNTLSPNCTTEIFDLLDILPRLNGKLERFVVSVSLDPVAGPSIQALQARQLITKRIQNFEDELKGVKAELRIPEIKQILPPFIPAVAGHPWSLVVVSPDMTTLRESDKGAISELKKELVAHTFKVLQGYVSGKLLAAAADTEIATSILMNVILTSQSDLAGVFKRFRERMSDDDHMIGVYLVPVEGVPATTSLAKFGLNLAVPFPVIEEKYVAKSFGELPIYRKIYAGAVAVADRGMNNNVPAYLLGTGIVIHASRKNSSVTIQSMVGLNAKAQKLERSDKQVNIHRFDIPDVSYPQNVPVAVVTSTVPLPLPANFRPKVKIDFGPIGKIVEFDDFTKVSGILQPWSPVIDSPESHGMGAHQICIKRANSTPTIVGNLSKSASGVAIVDKIIEGNPIFFKIQSVTVDLKSLSVSDMDIRSDLPPLYCLGLEDINKKFKENANGDAQKLKNKIINFVQHPFVELIKMVGF
jgi:hypothetical protein